MLYQVTTPSACFGVVVTAGRVTEAAPIGRKLIGRAWAEVRAQYQARRASVVAVGVVAPWAVEASGLAAIVREYWAGEVARGSVALGRLERVCRERGWEYRMTVEALR